MIRKTFTVYLKLSRLHPEIVHSFYFSFVPLCNVISPSWQLYLKNIWLPDYLTCDYLNITTRKAFGSNRQFSSDLKHENLKHTEVETKILVPDMFYKCFSVILAIFKNTRSETHVVLEQK